MRRGGRLACCLALLLAVLFAAIGDSSQLRAEDWPMGRGDRSGTGATQVELPDQLELLWEVELGGLGFDVGPIIADSKVFAADADGRVIALHLDSGQEIWQVKQDAGFMASPSYHAGVLYVGDYDGTLRALDADTGREKWKFAGEMEVNGSPNFYGELVLFTSQSGNLYAVDRESGELKWKYETGDQLQCGATLIDNRTFLGGCDGFLHVVDVDTGKAIGSPLPIDSPTGSTPAVRDGLVFVPTYAGEILAFRSPSNELAWRFKNEQMASEFKNSVAVADGVLVATSRNRRLFALDAQSGEVKWEQTLRKRSDASPVIAGTKIVVTAADGRIIISDLQTGKEQWLFEVKGSFLGSPAVADGKLVIASDRGTIFCFGAAAAK